MGRNNLTQLLKTAFPECSGLGIVEDASEVEPLLRYFVISGPQGPRWLVPQDPRLGLPVISSWRPYGVQSRIKWFALLRLYQLGQLRQMPNVTSIGMSACRSSLPQHNDERSNLYPVIYVGTEGKHRKLVSILVSAKTYQPMLVEKIPLTALAKQSIANEYDTLVQLKDMEGVAPIPLGYNVKNGCTTQQIVTGKLSSSKFLSHYPRYLEQLGQNSLDHNHYFEALFRKNNALSTSDDEYNLLPRIYDELSRLSKKTVIDPVRIHGDFAPWNIKIERDQVTALDWEASETIGSPSYDMLYFSAIQNHLFSNKENLKLPALAHSNIRDENIIRLSLIEMLLNQLIRDKANSFCQYLTRQLGWL